MNDVPEPVQGTSRRLHACTPYSASSRNPSRTPRFTKTPRSIRVTASTRAVRADGGAEEFDYQGLLHKVWRVYCLSPLYKFKSHKTSLTKYARSLDFAFSQVPGARTRGDGSVKCSFSIYEGLNFHRDDAKAVQIQISEKTESAGGAKIVLNAFLVCVDLDSSPVPAGMVSHFTYYPVILVAGNKSRTETLLSWLERHFDCRSHSVTFSDNDLRWMLASWSTQSVPQKAFPVLLQYSLEDLCEGIATIDCKFDAAFCRELWERLHGDLSAQQMLNKQEVDQFVNALEEHLEYTMNIVFTKMSLSEVGTSVAYVSREGKIKIFSSSGVFPALHLICEIINDRFMEIGSN